MRQCQTADLEPPAASETDLGNEPAGQEETPGPHRRRGRAGAAGAAGCYRVGSDAPPEEVRK